MFWDNANKPVLELLRKYWNSWTPWTSYIMQINQLLNSLHSLSCSWIFWYMLEIQKVTFSMCFLRCSGLLNFCSSYAHTDSGKSQESQGKLLFPFNSVNVSLKYQYQLQWKLWTAEICILCLRNLGHFRILN